MKLRQKVRVARVDNDYVVLVADLTSKEDYQSDLVLPLSGGRWDIGGSRRTANKVGGVDHLHLPVAVRTIRVRKQCPSQFAIHHLVVSVFFLHLVLGFTK